MHIINEYISNNTIIQLLVSSSKRWVFDMLFDEAYTCSVI